MNVLLVNKFHWLKGGSEAVYFGLMNLLEENGHSVIPFSMKDARNVPTPWERFFVENVRYDGGGVAEKARAGAKIVFNLDARRKMASLLREFSPQVAHFHIFQHQISPSVFGPLRKHGVPLVLTLHDLKPMCPNYQMLADDGVCERCKGGRFYNCAVHRCSKGSLLKSVIGMTEMYFHYLMGYYRDVDRYIAVSRFYRDKLIEFGFEPGKVVHVPNFVDCAKYSPKGADDGYGLYFGRLSSEKGVATLLRALALRPDVPFVIAGAGPAEAQLMELAAGLPNVSFVGFRTGTDLIRLIESSSFTVIPSEWYENCPMSVLESFAAGVPVVGAAIGGIPELIDEGADGLTFPPGDHRLLAEALGKLWDSQALRKEMGRSARSKVESRFSPEIHYNKTMEVYDGVIRR